MQDENSQSNNETTPPVLPPEEKDYFRLYVGHDVVLTSEPDSSWKKRGKLEGTNKEFLLIRFPGIDTKKPLSITRSASVKPVLYPLSEISVDDLIKVQQCFSGEFSQFAFVNSFLEGTIPGSGWKLKEAAKAVDMLRAMGYDMDDLIENDKAIKNKNTDNTARP